MRHDILFLKTRVVSHNTFQIMTSAYENVLFVHDNSRLGHNFMTCTSSPDPTVAILLQKVVKFCNFQQIPLLRPILCNSNFHLEAFVAAASKPQ